jgi:hypothetical protein
VKLTIIQDHSYYTFSVFQYVIVPETQYFEPLFLQPGGSIFIFSLEFYVLTTIYFNDYSLVETDEVNYVTAYGFLSSEFQTVESLRAKMLPQQSFSISRLLSEFPSFFSPAFSHRHSKYSSFDGKGAASLP